MDMGCMTHIRCRLTGVRRGRMPMVIIHDFAMRIMMDAVSCSCTHSAMRQHKHADK